MPAPTLLGDDEEEFEQEPTEAEEEHDEEAIEAADADDEATEAADDDETTMPEDTDPELEDEELEEEQTDAAEDEDLDPEDVDVASASMPGDDDAAPDADGAAEGRGIMSRLNVKAIVALAAVVVVGVILLSLLRGRGSSSRTPATEADLQGDGPAEHEQYDVSAPDTEPLEQDRQMMRNLGMGGQ